MAANKINTNQQMQTNIRMAANKMEPEKVMYPDLSYMLAGVLFPVHNYS